MRPRPRRLREEQLIARQQSHLDQGEADEQEDRVDERELHRGRPALPFSTRDATVHSPPPGR